MHAPYLWGFERSDTVNWCMVVRCTQNVRRDGSSFTRHQPGNTNGWILNKQKQHQNRYKMIQSLIQNQMRHERSETAREQRTALYNCIQKPSMIIIMNTAIYSLWLSPDRVAVGRTACTLWLWSIKKEKHLKQGWSLALWTNRSKHTKG